MPLRTVLARVAADMGYTLSNSSDRTYLIDRIQEAGKTLYDTHDLPGCEREQIFQLTDGKQLVTLPWYVKKVLRIRDYETRTPVDVVDMRPRYMSGDWVEDLNNYIYAKWRKTGVDGLKSRIDGASKMRLTFSLPIVTPVAVTINGSTDSAGRVTETLVFAAGDTVKVTTNLFTGVNRNGIKKTGVTSSDLSVTTGDDTEICFIPNHMLTVEHLVLQVQDRNASLGDRKIEILFKTAYEPMLEDEDCFMLGEEFEEALFFQTMALLYSKQEGKQDMVAMMGQAAQAQITQIAASIQPDDSDIMVIGDNRTYNVMRYAGYTQGFYGGSRL